jgi:RimJ/RimL family protein N-acetyltransferase
MRTAVLALAFDSLAALEARSSAFLDNPASLRVSRKLGYADDGTEVYAREGRRAVEQRFCMSVEAWRAVLREPVEIEGLEPCLPLLGLAAGDQPVPPAAP